MEQKRQEAQATEQKLRDEESKFSSQRALRQQLTGIQGQQARKFGQQQIGEGLRNVQRFKTEILTPYEQQIQATEQQIGQVEARQSQYEYALKAYLGLTSGSQINEVPLDIRNAAQKQAEALERRSTRSYIDFSQTGAPIGSSVSGGTLTESGVVLDISPSKALKEYNKFQSFGGSTSQIQSYQSSLAPNQEGFRDLNADYLTDKNIISTNEFYSTEARQKGNVQANSFFTPNLDTTRLDRSVRTQFNEGARLTPTGLVAAEQYQTIVPKYQTEIQRQSLATPNFTPVPFTPAPEIPKLNPVSKFLRSDLSIGTIGGGRISVREAKDLTINRLGFAGRTAGVLIPETRGQGIFAAGLTLAAAPATATGYAVRTGLTAVGAVQSFNPNLTPEERTAARIGTLLALKPTLQEVPSSINLRGIREPTFFEVQRPFRAFGKEGTLSSYQITREISPPSLVRTNEGGFIGGRFVPPRLEITRTPLNVVNDNAFLTFTTRQGSKVGKLSVVEGTSVPRDVVELRSLPKTEQYAWQGLAERITGRPVTLKNVPRVLKNNAELSSGYGQEVRLAGANRRTIYTSANQFEQTGKTATYDIFTGKTTFKDITRPGARASGRTPSISGRVVRYREPFVIGEETGVNVIRPSDTATRTPLSTTFADTLQLTPKTIPKPIRQARAKLINSKSTSGVYGISSVLSGSRSGVSNILANEPSDFISDFGRGRSAFTLSQETKQKGQAFEFTGSTISNLPNQNTRQNDFLQFGLRQGQSNRQLEFLGTNQRAETLSKQRNQVVLDLLVSKDISGLKSFLGQQPRVAQQTRTIQRTTQVQKPISLLKQKSITRTTTRPKTQKQPKGFGGLLSKGSSSGRVNDFFEAFGRRRGKDISLGQFSTQREAESGLKKFLVGTLGASGKITKNRQPVAFEELDIFGSAFRPGKRDTTRVVQKRGTRLGTGFEVLEIQRARKNRGGQINWFA